MQRASTTSGCAASSVVCALGMAESDSDSVQISRERPFTCTEETSGIFFAAGLVDGSSQPFRVDSDAGIGKPGAQPPCTFCLRSALAAAGLRREQQDFSP